MSNIGNCPICGSSMDSDICFGRCPRCSTELRKELELPEKLKCFYAYDPVLVYSGPEPTYEELCEIAENRVRGSKMLEAASTQSEQARIRQDTKQKEAEITERIYQRLSKLRNEVREDILRQRAEEQRMIAALGKSL